MNKERYIVNALYSSYSYDNRKPPSIIPSFIDYEIPNDNFTLVEHYFYFKENNTDSVLFGLFSDIPDFLKDIFGDNRTTIKVNCYTGSVYPPHIVTERKNFDCLVSDLDIKILGLYANRKISQEFINFLKFGAINFSLVKQVDDMFSIGFYSKSETNKNIKDLVLNKFLTKWTELYETIQKKYDILKPFDISLSESESDKLKTIQDTSNRVINETLKTDYQTLKDESETKTNDKVYAYNSGGGVNSDSGDSSTKNQFSSLNNDTKTGSTTDTRNYERDITKSRDYSRSGNIGNRSYSELIIKEREKLMFNLQDIILEDIASVLCSYNY